MSLVLSASTERTNFSSLGCHFQHQSPKRSGRACRRHVKQDEDWFSEDWDEKGAAQEESEKRRNREKHTHDTLEYSNILNENHEPDGRDLSPVSHHSHHN